MRWIVFPESYSDKNQSKKKKKKAKKKKDKCFFVHCKCVGSTSHNG